MLSVSDDLTDRIKGHDLSNEELKEEFRACIETLIAADSVDVYQAIFAMPGGEVWQAYANKAYPSGGSAAVIGGGDHSLARYLLEMLLPPVGGLERIDTCQGAIIASYALQKLKKYVHGCGGETDIFVLPSSRSGVVRLTGILGAAFDETEPLVGLWLRTMAKKEIDLMERDRASKALSERLATLGMHIGFVGKDWPYPFGSSQKGDQLG
jgi:hypothetical protein